MDSFDRWLLNTFSTFELVLLITGAFVICALAGDLIVRRLFPHFSKGENNEVTGFLLALVAVLYGIVLGFVIIAIYERFISAEDNVNAEASALSQVYRDTFTFPPAVERPIRKLIEDYSYDVRTVEWKTMKHGHESELAAERVAQLEEALEAFEPKTANQQIYLSQAATKVNDLVTFRRTRLSQAEEALPSVFQFLLLGGAIVTISFLFFFGMPNRRAQLVLVGATAALIGFSLALALILDFPFSGQVTVSNAAFHQGALATLGP